MFFIFFLRSFGYGLAVLSAVLVTLFFPLMPELVSWHDPMGLLAIFAVGCVITGLGALPGFLLAVIYQSRNGLNNWYYWVGAGVGAAVFANFLIAILFAPITDFFFFNSSLAGGVAGGFVYSLFHNRIIFHQLT